MGISDGWQMDVQTEDALPIYREFWPECEVVENDSIGQQEQVAKILDFGDVDKIIRLPGQQIHMAQRFRKPYYDHGSGEWVHPDFTLRYSRPTSDNIIEYERLMEAHETAAAAYPRRYSFGRVHTNANRGLYELYILDTDVLIDAIKSGGVNEHGPIETDEGQEFMAYKINAIDEVGAVIHQWRTDESKETEDIPDGLTAVEYEKIQTDPVLTVNDVVGGGS